MGRNSKLFSQSTKELPPYSKKLALEDPLLTVYSDLSERVARGKNFARKQQNKERLHNFVLNLISTKQRFEQGNERAKNNVDEIARLEYRINRLLKENETLHNRNQELAEQNRTFKRSKNNYQVQEKGLSNVLETEMRLNSKLVRENEELKSLFKKQPPISPL